MIADYLNAKNAKAGREKYVLEDYAPYRSEEIGAAQWRSGEWLATSCQPAWYGAPVVVTERCWWMDDLSDWAAAHA